MCLFRELLTYLRAVLSLPNASSLSLSLLCSDELDCVVRGDSHGHFFDSRKWGRRRRRQLFFFSLLLPRDKSYRLDSF